MTLYSDHPRRRETSVISQTHSWTIAVRILPWRLGYLVGLRHGEMRRGLMPFMLFSHNLSWWWRPSFYGALAKGEREARRAQ